VAVVLEAELGAVEVGVVVGAGDAVELDDEADADVDEPDELDGDAAEGEADDVPEADVPDDDVPDDDVDPPDEAGADVADEVVAAGADEAGVDGVDGADEPDDVAEGLEADVDDPDVGATAFVTGAVADFTVLVTPETAVLTPEPSDGGPDAEALEAARRQRARATMLVAVVQSGLNLSLSIVALSTPSIRNKSQLGTHLPIRGVRISPKNTPIGREPPGGKLLRVAIRGGRWAGVMRVGLRPSGYEKLMWTNLDMSLQGDSGRVQPRTPVRERRSRFVSEYRKRAMVSATSGSYDCARP
jgi:hypothetical protein